MNQLGLKLFPGPKRRTGSEISDEYKEPKSLIFVSIFDSTGIEMQRYSHQQDRECCIRVKYNT